MLIGYVRVSTQEQNEMRQVVALQERGVDKLFTDKRSGKNTDRAALKEMLSFMREGDTVITESISRIARSTRDLLNIVDAAFPFSFDRLLSVLLYQAVPCR